MDKLQTPVSTIATLPRRPYLTDPALRRAFTHVKDNHGCPGCDAITLDQFAATLPDTLRLLRESVHDESYFAWPLRRIQVQRHPDSDETRTLLVPAIADRVLQTAVAAYFEPFLEKEFDDCSFAYRRGRSVRMAVERVHALHQHGYTWLIDADIDDFFDSVVRDMVLGRLSPLIPDELAVRLARLWLDYNVWDGLHVTRPELGLAQGSVISPMLANLCLDTLDDRLLAAGIEMVRYADDFVVLAKSRKAAERAYQLTEETLTSLRLRLEASKTRIVRFGDGFQFLGVIFLKDLLMQPWKPGRKPLKIFSAAGPLPPQFFPQSERRPLRKYRAF